jgi:hypothetical protein
LARQPSSWIACWRPFWRRSVGLLVLLLVEREVIRAWTGGRATGRVLSTAIVPLLVVVALILASRASTVLP